MAGTTRPAVEGWFETGGDGPRLIGLRCESCGTVVFPPRAVACPNPTCEGDELERTPLSGRGRIWSYATNHYAPPEPYVSPEPFEPYTVAAVELADEQLVVLGQLAGSPNDIEVGSEVELVVDTLFTDDDGIDHTVWKWSPA